MERLVDQLGRLDGVRAGEALRHGIPAQLRGADAQTDVRHVGDRDGTVAHLDRRDGLLVVEDAVVGVCAVGVFVISWTVVACV